jgi:uncharacterized protein (TIGR00730 family)
VTNDSSAQLRSRSYVPPIEDQAFLLRDEMRSIRLALEYSKADLLLREWGIRSTIIVFGGSRVPSSEQAECAIAKARELNDEQTLARLSRQVAWYESARIFAQIASRNGGAATPENRWRDNVIATGGGPGIMEAANRGASEVGAPSIGFNIMLPTEQRPNPYSTPELTFRFHYFAIRKMHLAMRANALAIFPGGFGTMDELFEILTLRQTHKAPRIPIVLFDKGYWQRMINFEALAAEGMTAGEDMELFDYADSAEEAWAALVKRGIRTHGPIEEPIMLHSLRGLPAS